MGYVGKDCDLLGWFNGDRNKRAIGAEELVYLLAHPPNLNHGLEDLCSEAIQFVSRPP